MSAQPIPYFAQNDASERILPELDGIIGMFARQRAADSTLDYRPAGKCKCRKSPDYISKDLITFPRVVRAHGIVRGNCLLGGRHAQEMSELVIDLFDQWNAVNPLREIIDGLDSPANETL